jgi:predicted RNA-binding protein with RPS1 domain
MEIGRLGVWSFTDLMDASAAAEFVQRIEALGYGALWIPEAVGMDPFVRAAFLLERCENLVVATGIANIYARDPMAMKGAQYALASQYDGRFLLGLGVSHAPFVEDMRGHHYDKPVATMRRYLEAMEKAMYAAPPPAEPPPIVIGALREKMLTLSVNYGEKVKVHVINVDPDRSRVALSIKRLHPNPWATAHSRYQSGQVTEATIISIVPFGAFARLEEGLDGLIHVSEMSQSEEPVDPKELLNIGQQVQVQILHVDAANQRLGLSLDINQ